MRRIWHKVNFMPSSCRLNSGFALSYTVEQTMVKEPNVFYYLPKAEEVIGGFIPFQKVLALYEMQTASSRFWTRVTVSILFTVYITPR